MSTLSEFSEISVLIPGYSVEDLPTDLPEDEAASLLNSFACAWHPDVLARTSGIPILRQAESLTGYPGRRIIFVPRTSESWMPHEWRSALRSQDHLVIDSCHSRKDWLSALQNAFSTEPQPLDPHPVLMDDFLALGTVMVQNHLLSRRRHHFVDSDVQLLGREARAAAVAALAGDESTVRVHLTRCFEHLREVRERFHPMPCYLLDLCIPGEADQAHQIRELLESNTSLNLFATGDDLLRWKSQDPEIGPALGRSMDAGRICLLTGHQTETRSGLGSLSASLSDLRCGLRTVTEVTGLAARHWARRRFGLTASLPAVLNYFGFESAQHVALDDGLYPDKERSQFDWQGTDGSCIAASSRIPLAVDSAAGFLRFADRYSESMQDDTTAAIFLARLPQLKSPWLQDLRIAAGYAPVLGEFVTMEKLSLASGGSRFAERHDHSEYLSPSLVQSAVLKTEPAVSGPAALRILWQRLTNCQLLRASAAVAKVAAQVLTDTSALIEQLEKDLLQLELTHVDITSVNADRPTILATRWNELSGRFDQLESQFTQALRVKIPSDTSDGQGLLVLNTVPFARTVKIDWPAQWKSPAANSAIDALQSQNSAQQLLVKMPPGGFVWLNEAMGRDTIHPVTLAQKNEPPLAESLKLRNRHFEITLSARTGGIESVVFHGQRLNRLSQQPCFRYEREQTLPDDGSGEVRKSTYAVPELSSHRVVECGPVFATIETTTQLRAPTDGQPLTTVVQTISVDRLLPRLTITQRFQDIRHPVKGNPWLTYFGSRFAWDNESAAITRAVMDQAAGFRSERIESPDYVEISDADHRIVIAPHGRPWHRRSGPRMLDSLLIVEGETETTFQFTIEFDQAFPLRTATDAMSPPATGITTGHRPRSTSAGWLLGLTARNVQLVRSDWVPASPDHSEELCMIICETEGVSGDCLIRTARQPTTAFAINADRSEKHSLEVSEQGVRVPLTAFQIRGISLQF
jgi:alpha-mannosidase